MLVKRFKKISRNELCPCGSGKKFKHCECYKIVQDSKYILKNKNEQD